jgi:hypoxia up-regulated 1
MRPATVLSGVVALVSLLSPTSAASLLAIDYGTDSFKASLVKPGVPFDVLVTKEGRRKTASLVTLRGEDRSFGGEAANLVSRRLPSSFSSLDLTRS